MTASDDLLIEVKGLHTHFFMNQGVVKAVDGVDLQIKRGETMGIVGESGCGKSVTARSVMQLIQSPPGRIVQGEILFYRDGGREVVDITGLDAKSAEMRRIRGGEIAMVFQEPMTSLNPLFTVGSQISEAVELHQRVSEQEARERAIQMLEEVGIAMPRQRYSEYPHQFSGGMRQRAMIAMALSCNPRLLIADEPTTALDVTIQAQILELMKSLQDEFGMAMLMITHNLGVIAEMSDRVAVMYMGRIVESGDARTIFHRPLHPYTVGLMRSIPHLGRRERTRLTPIPGSVPDPYSVPAGCAFLPRCPVPKMEACYQTREEASLVEVEPGHFVRCPLYM